MIDFRLLVKAGVHFGHQSSRWCPRMAPFIWGKKNGVHLIDVSKTAAQMEKAAQFLEAVTTEGKTVLWVGTKKPAQDIITAAGKESNMPFVTHRWIGGTLTNRAEVKKSITKYLHLQDVLDKSSDLHYTKKELNSFQKRVERLNKNIGGIIDMRFPIGAIVVVDVRKELSVVKEAAAMGIPVIALVDTNSDPLLVDYVIPGNDDAPKAIKVVIDYLVEAAKKGVSVAEQKRNELREKEAVLLGEKKKKAAPVQTAPAAQPEAKKVEAQETVEAVEEETAPAKKSAPAKAPKKAVTKK